MSLFRLWSAAAISLLRAFSLVVVCLSATPAAAQDASGQPPADDEPPPAHLSIADGAVTIQREGVAEPAQSGVPLVPGDQLRTARGRAEAIFPDGTALALDEFTAVDVQSSTLLRLTTGRVLVTVARMDIAGGGTRYQIDTPAGTATLDGPGEYAVGLLGTPSQPQVEFAVRRGRGELITDAGAVALRSGERSLAWAETSPAPPQPFNSARMDALDRWAAMQRDARTGSRSAAYLPADLRPYSGAFDRFGAWQYDAAYGNVWYPSVAPGWRPYYNGYWTSVPRYGWTWIGFDRWAWPTHHYGRWGYARSRWFWIPDRRWAPAWVAWGAAPGYVGWSPLGFDNRPVFGLSVSFGAAWGGGWVVLPRARFGARGYYVPQYAVSYRTLSPRTPFVVQSVPPIAPRHAPARIAAGRPPAPDFGRRAPRNAAGGRPPGIAVPRNPTTQGRTLGPGGPVGAASALPAARGTIDAGAPGRTGTSDAVGRSGGPSAVRRGIAGDRAQPPAAFDGAEGGAVRPRSPGRMQGWPGQSGAAPGAPVTPPAVQRGGGRPDAAGDGRGRAVRREPGGRVYSPPPVSAPSVAAPDRGGAPERGGPRNMRSGGGAPGGAVYRGGDARAGVGGRERGGAGGGGRTGNAGARRAPR